MEESKRQTVWSWWAEHIYSLLFRNSTIKMHKGDKRKMNMQECGLELKGAREERDCGESLRKSHTSNR